MPRCARVPVMSRMTFGAQRSVHVGAVSCRRSNSTFALRWPFWRQRSGRPCPGSARNSVAARRMRPPFADGSQSHRFRAAVRCVACERNGWPSRFGRGRRRKPRSRRARRLYLSWSTSASEASAGIAVRRRDRWVRPRTDLTGLSGMTVSAAWRTAAASDRVANLLRCGPGKQLTRVRCCCRPQQHSVRGCPTVSLTRHPWSGVASSSSSQAASMSRAMSRESSSRFSASPRGTARPCRRGTRRRPRAACCRRRRSGSCRSGWHPGLPRRSRPCPGWPCCRVEAGVGRQHHGQSRCAAPRPQSGEASAAIKRADLGAVGDRDGEVPRPRPRRRRTRPRTWGTGSCRRTARRRRRGRRA